MGYFGPGDFDAPGPAVVGSTAPLAVRLGGVGIRWATTITAEVRHLSQVVDRQQPAAPLAPSPATNSPVTEREAKGM